MISETDEAKGTVIAEGRAEYDARLDDAISRVMIVADSDRIVQAALKLAKDLNDLILIRAQRGPGRIPNEDVHRLRAAEQDFANVVRLELAHASLR
ncbi:hypothetical protein ACFRAQ_09110 [Nocardia sp. NPDC056611]|uniref:hypothetical protein n=1 Tax=Nocardia sp. NPDC056611 TaxID=3345877 RepID=UPI003671BFA5